MSAADQARYVPARAFPPYAYVSGRAPHPVTDPRGHLYGHVACPAPAVDSPIWWTEFDYARDLWNHGYYWEAHEVWEGLWHGVPRAHPWGLLLQGLIKLAAAGVKAREGRPEGVRRHAVRARELMSSARAGWTEVVPIAAEVWERWLGIADAIARQPTIQPATDDQPAVVWDARL